MSRTRTHRRRGRATLLALVVLLAAGGYAASTAAAATPTDPDILEERQDLRGYYPNPRMARQGQYLEGFNYISGEARRSVLWFDWQGRGWFNQYNWGPEDAQSECHYDRMRWRSTLRYFMTHDSCGDVIRETSFSPPIHLMPRRWRSGDEWERSGTSDVTHTEDGEVACEGTMDWTGKVLGWVEIDPGVFAIHVTTDQVTTWTEGQSSTGCAAGFTTTWQEEYWLMPDLPVDGGGTANAFKQSAGGNRDGGPDTWNVSFDIWKELP
ncbi:MAG: hypothetical protein P8N02_08835 [Actinomycetota bacterium]|nr:hypothetical protein [Actinomycetota bacterium]